jgi:uncharacterized protein (TIGR03435 family)
VRDKTRACRKILGLAALIAVGASLAPVSHAQTPDQPIAQQPLKPMATDKNPAFEVATIKLSSPDAQGRGLVLRHSFSAHNFTLNDLMVFAYDVQVKQIVGAPDWFVKEKFDIAAIPDAEGQPSPGQFKAMVQKLLADRFNLILHHEMRELPAFVLTVAKNGLKLKKNESGDPGPGKLNMRLTQGGMMLTSTNETMAEFASSLQQAVVDRPVVNRTELTERFDFQFTFAPDGSQFGGMHLPPQNDEGAAPSLFTAIQDLGLKLDAFKIPVDVLVIDHAAMPSAN